MAVLISDDFSSDTSANWNGVALTIAGGNASVTGDGFAVHQTSLGAVDSWMAVDLLDSSQFNLLVIGADASGNGVGIVVTTGGADCILTQATEYTTYSTYAASDDALGNITIAATFADGDRIGVTMDKTNEILRFWANPVAQEPDSITSWDSSAADGTVDMTTLTNNTAIPGDFVGIGSWDETSPIESYDNFEAGDFSVAGAAEHRPMMLLGVG